MSTFFDELITCPHCQTTRQHRVAHSINGARAPQYRAQILARKFQRVTCENCDQPFEINHPMAYVDLSRKQWFHVYAREQEAAWRMMEAETACGLDIATGSRAPGLARALLEGVTVRTVFGLAGLREKLICQEYALDDVVLEMLKLGLGRKPGGVPLSVRHHIRLLERSADSLLFSAADEVNARELFLELPHAKYDAMRAEAARGSGLYEHLAAGSYVDIGRLLIAGTSQEWALDVDLEEDAAHQIAP